MCVVYKFDNAYINDQGPNIMYNGASRGHSSFGQYPITQQYMNNRGSNHEKSPIFQPLRNAGVGFSHEPVQGNIMDRSSSILRDFPSRDKELRDRSDLHGVVLTLGGPGNSHV